jgi:pilus assembly protein Flp/PilA
MLNRIKLMLITKDTTGASAVEYGLLVAGIALVVIVGVFFLGGVVSSAFTEVGNSISGA